MNRAIKWCLAFGVILVCMFAFKLSWWIAALIGVTVHTVLDVIGFFIDRWRMQRSWGLGWNDAIKAAKASAAMDDATANQIAKDWYREHTKRGN